MTTPTARIKQLMAVTVGEADRQRPCPHRLVLHDEIPHPDRPKDRHRRIIRNITVVCGIPGSTHDEHRGEGHTWR